MYFIAKREKKNITDCKKKTEKKNKYPSSRKNLSKRNKKKS